MRGEVSVRTNFTQNVNLNKMKIVESNIDDFMNIFRYYEFVTNTSNSAINTDFA